MSENPVPNPRYAWRSRPDGRTFNNLTIPDTAEGRLELAEITGDALMEAAARAGARMAVFDAKQGAYAFHNTAVSEKHPGLGDRDLVAEMIAAGDRKGVVYVPYVFVGGDMRATREHPDWQARRADGTGLDDGYCFPLACLNSPFRGFIRDYLVDLATRHDIGGLYLDGLWIVSAPAACYCRWCREGFRAAYGHDAPLGPESGQVWADWGEFRENATRDILREWRTALHAVRPGLPLAVCTIWHNWQSHASAYYDQADFVVTEPNYGWSAATNQYLRAQSGKPSEDYILSFQSQPAHPIALPAAELRRRAMTALASGATPNFTLFGNLDAIAEVNAEVAERAPYMANAEPAPYCGIVFSRKSMHRCDPSPYAEGSHFTTYGTLKALLDEKIPEQYVADPQLESGNLSDFSVLILPDVGYLSEQALDTLRRYVEKGGGLVVTHRTSLLDGLGQLRSDFGLADLLGVHYMGRMNETTRLPGWSGDTRDGAEETHLTRTRFLRMSDHPIIDDTIRAAYCCEVVPAFRRGLPRDPFLAYGGAMLQVTPEAGTEVVLWDDVQDPNTPAPMLTVRSFGAGRVAYFAADLGFQYCDRFTHPYVARLLGNAVRWAAGGKPAPCAVEAPRHVQATVFQQASAGRTVVHLLNDPQPIGLPPFSAEEWNGHFKSFGRVRSDVSPIPNITVRLPGTYRRIYAVPGGQDLPSKQRDGETVISMPRLEMHLLVVAEGPNGL